MEKFNKISSDKLNVEVLAQGCGTDCKETIWAGKTSSEGNAGGCWTTTGYTPRSTTWW